MNARVESRATIERASLRPLPLRRTAEFTEFPARVSKYGIFTIKGAKYSAPSRLIGHLLSVRQYADRIECWLGGNRVLECPRATYRGSRHARQIDYRHVIESLKRKPGAFARWVLRDDAFPRSIYRTTWEALSANRPEREACRTMVGLLVLAADGHEAEIAIELEGLRAGNALPDLDAISQRFHTRQAVLPALDVPLPDPGVYDALLGETP